MISTPSAESFLTASGTVATLRSPAAVSFGTESFIRGRGSVMEREGERLPPSPRIRDPQRPGRSRSSCRWGVDLRLGDARFSSLRRAGMPADRGSGIPPPLTPPRLACAT